jgi:CubicO group peptidase (beta-lactamase class C family)
MHKTSIAIAGLLLLLVFVAADPTLAADSAPVGNQSQIFQPKYEAGSFRHMDKLFPSHKILRSGPVSELPRGPQMDDVAYSWNGAPHHLSDMLARTDTTGFLVLKNGQIVMEKYFGGADETSKFTSWSVAKSFTSTLVGLALADGKIASINDPVTKYVPDLKGSGYDGVPIKDILQMSSGVKFNEEYTNAQSDVVRWWQLAMVEHRMSLNDFLEKIPGGAEAPGTKFVYRSADTQVLGWLVSRVTGKDLADDLTERVWGPLGMEHDATWLTDRDGPDGMEAAFCCINATLRDYARFGMLFANGGKWGGKQIVPESWVHDATTPQSQQVAMGALFPRDPYDGYGYQWWLRPAGAFSAEGIHFQFIFVNPAEKLVIVKTSATPDAFNLPLAIETFIAFDAIAADLAGR